MSTARVYLSGIGAAFDNVRTTRESFGRAGAVRRISSVRRNESSYFFRYLPSPPYQDNPVLHLYAGLVCLYLVQPTGASAGLTGVRSLRDAEHYLERAKFLDPNNVVARTWLQMVYTISSNTSCIRNLWCSLVAGTGYILTGSTSVTWI